MSADEHGLGDKAHSERFAHSVADFARKRQKVGSATPVAHCQRQSVPA
jgi:hypothetical protein